MSRSSFILLLFISSLWISGCSNKVKNSSDRTIFGLTGKTHFSYPEKVTIKQLQFSAARFIDQKVEFSGKLDKSSSGNTYLITEDQGAKILVKTTRIHGFGRDELKNKNGKKISVLGSVVYGKRGLPIIDADAIYMY